MNNKIGTLSNVLVFFLMGLYVLSVFIPTASARDSFAPSWLKEGAYVTYVTAKGSVACVFNVSDPQYKGLNWSNAPSYDLIKYRNASLTWRCISITGTTAKLQVTFDYVGEELRHFVGASMTQIPLNGESLQMKGEVSVDLYSRAVYSSGGVLLGTTHLWLPANPVDGQELVVWDVGSEVVTLPATVNDNVWLETVQGKQIGFQVGGTIAVNGENRNIMMTYDLDTGLGIDGSFEWDPIMAAIGVSSGSLESFSDTNISLGVVEDPSFNWTLILQYALLPLAVVLFVVAFIIKRRKR